MKLYGKNHRFCTYSWRIDNVTNPVFISHLNWRWQSLEIDLDTLSGENGGGKNKVVINFVSPPSQEKDIILENDSWTIKPASSN